VFRLGLLLFVAAQRNFSILPKCKICWDGMAANSYPRDLSQCNTSIHFVFKNWPGFSAAVGDCVNGFESCVGCGSAYMVERFEPRRGVGKRREEEKIDVGLRPLMTAATGY